VARVEARPAFNSRWLAEKTARGSPAEACRVSGAIRAAMRAASDIFEVDVTTRALAGAFTVRLAGSIANAGGCTLAIRGLVRPLDTSAAASVRDGDGLVEMEISRTLVAIAEALAHLAEVVPYARPSELRQASSVLPEAK